MSQFVAPPSRGSTAGPDAALSGPPAEPPSAPGLTVSKIAEPIDTLDLGALTADLEQHPYRLFGDKRCYLIALLYWERLDAEHRWRTPNPMPVWKPLCGTVLQLDGSGLLLQKGEDVVFVKNHPAQNTLTNGQAVAFHAVRPPGETYDYTKTDGTGCKVDAYDYGIPFQPKLAPRKAGDKSVPGAHEVAVRD